MKIKVAPSILSADFGCLEEEIKRVEEAGADMLHIDVMDGHFVSNITVGGVVIKALRRITRLPLDVHLMIERPERLIEAFVDVGSDLLTVHIETISGARLKTQSAKLKNKGVKFGISLNPPTPLAKIKNVLRDVDFVLVMTVNPGFGGQKFISKVVPKIKQLRRIFKGDIAVDGGINDQNARKVVAAGANILAAGTYIFKSDDYRRAIRRLKWLAR